MGDGSIAVAAKPTRKINNFTHEFLLVVLRPQHATLRCPSLPQHTAGSALGDAKLLSNIRDSFAPTLRAQKFPKAVSRRIELSSA